jgi:hypothetical protein
VSIQTTTASARVPPIKLLGARRAFASLAGGAILGPAVGFVVSILFLPVATTASRRTGLVVMSLLFGLIFGPMMSLGAASMLAVAGFSGRDFAAVGWGRLSLFSLLGCGVGIGAGFLTGTLVAPSDAIVFMLSLLGGIVGALVPGSVLVGKEAKRRLGQ